MKADNLTKTKRWWVYSSRRSIGWTEVIAESPYWAVLKNVTRVAEKTKKEFTLGRRHNISLALKQKYTNEAIEVTWSNEPDNSELWFIMDDEEYKIKHAMTYGSMVKLSTAVYEPKKKR